MIRVQACFAALICVFFASSGYGAPALQLYLEGGTYDDATDSWVLTPAGSSGGAPFRIWTIGNVGSKGTISDVRLSVAYLASDLGLEITMTPSQVGGLGVGTFGGVDDPFFPPDSPLPITPVKQTAVSTSLGLIAVGTEIDGVVAGVDVNGATIIVNEDAVPLLGDGSDLPSHGIFGPGVVWQEFALGDFALTDSHIGDFIGGFPTELKANAGQINAYDVSVIGGWGATLHFDLYDTIAAKNHAKAKFAPFSHDADADVNVVPEPASVLIWLLVGSVTVVLRLRRSR